MLNNDFLHAIHNVRHVEPFLMVAALNRRLGKCESEPTPRRARPCSD